MAEQLPDGPKDGHPIIAGLVALIGVALAVGLILGLVAVVGTKLLGVGDGSGGGDSSAQTSMYVPKPVETPTATGPDVTLAPGEPTATASSKPAKSKSPKDEITLSASVTSAAPMQTFTLTGTYASGEGAILQVQRFADGSWQDFPVTASVAGESFSTDVQTSQPGTNRFRVVDTDSDVKSNEVRVAIG